MHRVSVLAVVAIATAVVTGLAFARDEKPDASTPPHQTSQDWESNQRRRLEAYASRHRDDLACQLCAHLWQRAQDGSDGDMAVRWFEHCRAGIDPCAHGERTSADRPQ